MQRIGRQLVRIGIEQLVLLPRLLARVVGLLVQLLDVAIQRAAEIAEAHRQHFRIGGAHHDVPGHLAPARLRT